MKITDLKPTIVWKFFHQVTQVPRPSKKEGKMIEFLESFAKEYKIAIKKDEAGNLLMSKPATPGNGGSSGSRIAVSHGYGLREK